MSLAEALSELECAARDGAQTEALGRRLARGLRPGTLIACRGELGAGKTTFIRGVLRGLGHTAAVKSPTYTLVEPYRIGGLAIYHFDLYRVEGPEELEAIGVRDYMDGRGVCLVEWPERAAAMFSPPDLEVLISRRDGGRSLRLRAFTERGAQLLAHLR